MAITYRLTDDQRRLVEDNMGLVGYVMNRFGHQGLGFTEDAFQTGLVGLMKAAARYDSERGAKFSSFAVQCIINELKRERRSQCRAMRGYGMPPDSLDEQVLIDGVYLSRLENQPNPEIGMEERVAQEDALRRLLRPLARKHTLAARITLEHLLEGTTQVELAERYGLSQVCVSRYIIKSTRQLREQARKQGDVFP